LHITEEEAMSRKMFCFLLTTILLSFALNALAAEVTIFGPEQYIRNTGRPFTVTDSFPGVSGEANLLITNGDANGKNRVSSGTIMVNGVTVVTPDKFNKQVSSFEVPINVIEMNTISVQLASKPGSFITVTISEAEADPCAGYLVCQNFEGPGYDNDETWVEYPSGNTVNADYTQTALVGSQSLEITNTNGIDGFTVISFPPTNPLYIFLAIRPSTTTYNWFVNFNDSPAQQWDLGVEDATHMQYWNTSEADNFAYSLSTTDTTYIWIEYHKGTGSDGRFYVWLSSTTTKPDTATLSVENSGLQFTPTTIELMNRVTGTTVIYDKVLVSASSIESNP
jgi:hypothetical protein